MDLSYIHIGLTDGTSVCGFVCRPCYSSITGKLTGSLCYQLAVFILNAGAVVCYDSISGGAVKTCCTCYGSDDLAVCCGNVNGDLVFQQGVAVVCGNLCKLVFISFQTVYIQLAVCSRNKCCSICFGYSLTGYIVQSVFRILLCDNVVSVCLVVQLELDILCIRVVVIVVREGL